VILEWVGTTEIYIWFVKNEHKLTMTYLLGTFLTIACAVMAASAGRPLLSTARQFASACIGCGLFLSPMATIAAVGEGDLPAGAMAFSKLLKYQSDWNILADSVKVRKNEMDQKEILNVKFFLKQLANEYYDMDLLGNSIIDKEKSSRAKEIAKEFRKLVRECDDAASNSNLEKIVELYPKTSGQLKDFFLLLQDVPDEL
jgi:hypothetical protein